jgi:nucleoside-diphosphate-sugar epimerase
MTKPRIIVTGATGKSGSVVTTELLNPGFNFDRYDRELRRPLPSDPQFAPDSKVWRQEHATIDTTKPAALDHTPRPATTKRIQSLEFQTRR